MQVSNSFGEKKIKTQILRVYTNKVYCWCQWILQTWKNKICHAEQSYRKYKYFKCSLWKILLCNVVQVEKITIIDKNG